MTETKVKTLYDEIFEKGKADGMLKGMAKGMAVVMAKRITENITKRMTEIIMKEITEGIAEGIMKGMLEGRVSVILKLLEKRFGEVPIDIKEKINTLRKPIELELLAVQLLDCKSIEEFVDQLTKTLEFC
jgi:flagellar biosynthesis/type III secretory pathway protein FliH